MGLRDLLRRKRKTDSTPKRQKRFFCSNCENEIFLMMKHCNGCGGEIEWPEEYRHLIEFEGERENELKTTPINSG